MTELQLEVRQNKMYGPTTPNESSDRYDLIVPSIGRFNPDISGYGLLHGA